MKALRTHRWLAAVAAWLLLLGTAAPALERLSCSMGCPTIVGIGQVEDCCQEDLDHHNEARISSDCCDVERTAPEHYAFTTDSNPHPLVCALGSAALPMAMLPAQRDPAPGYGFSTRPPPLFTGERLSQVGSLLI